MIGTKKQEYEKDELFLNIDSFNRPKTDNDVNAWSQLILNLLFLKPGTYPSLPLMGVDIESYQFEFIEEAIAELTTSINDQQRTYLPDIPVTGITVSAMDYEGQKILLIQMGFNSKKSGLVSTVIAANTTPNKILDFDVSW